MEEGRFLVELNRASFMRTLDYFIILECIRDDGVDTGVTVPVVITAEDQQLTVTLELTTDIAKLIGQFIINILLHQLNATDQRIDLFLQYIKLADLL